MPTTRDLRWLEGDAAAIPLRERLGRPGPQLVRAPARARPRGRAARDVAHPAARRQPGGSHVARGRAPTSRPSTEFDEAVIDLGIPEPEDDEEERSGDFRSRRAAADELRRAGFERVSARQETLELHLDASVVPGLQASTTTTRSCSSCSRDRHADRLGTLARDRLRGTARGRLHVADALCLDRGAAAPARGSAAEDGTSSGRQSTHGAKPAIDGVLAAPEPDR